ncbi:MAG: ABC transporter permease [Candidatus Dormibacteria bacterium]
MLILAVVAAIFLALPLLGLLLRAPWGQAAREVGTAELQTALALSFTSALAATAVAGLLGLPLAWVLARFEFPGRALLRSLAMLPMVLPPVVGGVALLLVFGREGFIGGWLDRYLGFRFAFSTPGVVLAETFVALPFFVVTAEAGLRGIDRRLEEAARSLGAGPWRVAATVTLPLMAPSLAAGALLSWARALGEFGATITFAGNFPGRTQTLPLAIYVLLQERPETALTMSLVLVAVAVLVLALLRDRWLVRS